MELHAPGIVIVAVSVNTIINVTGGMAPRLSLVVFNKGENNVAKGIEIQKGGLLEETIRILILVCSRNLKNHLI